MQIGTNTLNSIDTIYTVRLNKEQVLVVEKDTKAQEEFEAKKEQEKLLKPTQKENAPNELSDDEEELVKKLQARDAEVKTHEAAHQAAGGGLTGAATFTYQQGPDGKMYAIGGEVSISMSSGSTPQETIAKARQLEASAMAAANPSPQDFSVASSARIMEMKAQQKLSKEQQQKMLGLQTYEANSL